MRCRWDPVYPTRGRRASSYADPGLRASDAERNEVVDKLSRHFADGRLDQGELKTRLDKAMGATTRGDLGGLFDDLPRLDDDPPPPPSRRRRLVPFLFIVALVTVAAGSIHTVVHLPWWVVGLVGIFLWRRAGWPHGAHHPQSEADR